VVEGDARRRNLHGECGNPGSRKQMTSSSLCNVNKWANN
jgi:hypothetical protein